MRRKRQQLGRQSKPVAKWWLLLVVSVTMSSIGFGCDADRAEAVRHLNEGMQAFHSDSSSAAVPHMERALEVDPTFAEAAYTLGQIQHQRLNNPEEAEQNFRRALDHDPQNPRYAYRLGAVLADQGEHDDAINYFDEAISNHSAYARAWFEKGMSLDAAGQPHEAVDSFMEAIEINPRLRLDEDDPGGEHYHALADLYIRYRLYDHAVRVYENGVRNNPDSPRLHHGLGVAQMELGRFDEAVDSFEGALEIDANHPSANFNIAIAMHESGQTEAAVEQLSELVEGGGRLSRARLQAAQALLDDLQAN